MSDEPETIAAIRRMVADSWIYLYGSKDEVVIKAADLLAAYDDLRFRLEAAREAREHVSSQLWDAEQTIAGLRARLAAYDALCAALDDAGKELDTLRTRLAAAERVVEAADQMLRWHDQQRPALDMFDAEDRVYKAVLDYRATLTTPTTTEDA